MKLGGNSPNVINKFYFPFPRPGPDGFPGFLLGQLGFGFGAGFGAGVFGVGVVFFATTLFLIGYESYDSNQMPPLLECHDVR